MEWIQNKTIYHTIEEAILGMSGQSAEELLSPREVPAEQVCGIKQAGETIEECIRKNMPGVIVGDYDADGITSTTILTRLLYSMGVKVRPIIPRSRWPPSCRPCWAVCPPRWIFTSCSSGASPSCRGT